MASFWTFLRNGQVSVSFPRSSVGTILTITFHRHALPGNSFPGGQREYLPSAYNSNSYQAIFHTNPSAHRVVVNRTTMPSENEGCTLCILLAVRTILDVTIH
jgi:hypothetical protein